MASGKGSSDSRTNQNTSTTTTQNTTNNVDNRAVEGDYARIGGNVNVNAGDGGGPLNISTTDQGAVAAGLDIALESLAGVQGLVKANASVASDSISQAYTLANQARQSETSGAINNALKYFAVVAVIGILAWAYARKK